MFCIVISVIELLSWMTECFYPFEAFCPEIRKLVPIQFFKIIFKECLVTMLRFMCNFTYVGFALNRIGLIGNGHGKIVTFISDYNLGIKKYIGFSLLISVSLSWIKGFKYEINYFYPYLSFPISNEIYVYEDTFPDAFLKFYYVFYSISELLNYFVFVIICVIIDICMVVQLKRTLDEKVKKSESLNQKQNQAKKAEFEEVVNKAIKMVVLNSLIGICFKIPVAFIPLINACGRDRLHQEGMKEIRDPIFFQFLVLLYESGAYSLIQDVSYLLYTLSLSIQMFIYKRFDKKFQTGFERIRDKAFSNIKYRFTS